MNVFCCNLLVVTVQLFVPFLWVIVPEFLPLRYDSHQIGHVNEYPTMHYIGNPGHALSVIAYMILTG